MDDWTEYLAPSLSDTSYRRRSQPQLHRVLQGAVHRRCTNIDYFVTDGTSLPPVTGIDFVWSFDAFVHMDRT